MWSAPVLTKYWLLQLPATAAVALVLYLLQDTIDLPTWALWSIVAIWIAKDAVLYPLVWRSYDPSPVSTTRALEGAQGIALDRLAPSGYVRVNGELWHAELTDHSSPIEQGAPVRVRAVRGLTLLVDRQRGEGFHHPRGGH